MNKIILILVVVVFALMASSYFYLGFQERGSKKRLVNEENVRGSAVVANGLNYTLNYSQQQDILSTINHSKITRNPKLPFYTPGEIESILIYLFDQQEPLELTPASDDFSLFKVKAYYLEIEDPEEMKTTLELAYDS